jgi:hypothetical protein
MRVGQWHEKNGGWGEIMGVLLTNLFHIVW